MSRSSLSLTVFFPSLPPPPRYFSDDAYVAEGAPYDVRRETLMRDPFFKDCQAASTLELRVGAQVRG